MIYEGIPVEMKTTARLPTSKMKNKSRKNFASKWRTNYLPQIAMYSHACELEWMFLLLISKETGEFSIIPVNGKEKMKGLRQKWKSWVDNGGKLMENITRYRKLGLNEEE